MHLWSGAGKAGGGGEEVSRAAAVDEDEGQGDQDGHEVGHKVVEGEGAGRGLEVADDHGGDGERHDVSDHLGRARHETRLGGTHMELELNKLCHVAAIGGGEEEEDHGEGVKHEDLVVEQSLQSVAHQFQTWFQLNSFSYVCRKPETILSGSVRHHFVCECNFNGYERIDMNR